MTYLHSSDRDFDPSVSRTTPVMHGIPSDALRATLKSGQPELGRFGKRCRLQASLTSDKQATDQDVELKPRLEGVIESFRINIRENRVTHDLQQ